MSRVMTYSSIFRLMQRVSLATALGLGVTASTVSSAAQQAPAAAGDLEVVQVQPNFYMLAGAGANIAVQVGDDGIVLVDTGSGEKSAQVLEALRRISPKPIRYIINTNADRDHAGGNDDISKAGRSIIPTGGLNEIGAAGGRAPILAEEHVQSRMTAPTGEQSPFPVGGWPTVTFSAELEELQKDLYLNGEAIQVFYQPAAHTDGDSIVFFRRSDVLVVGDVFDTTRFPFIDQEKGGTINGVIDSLNRIIAITVSPVPLTWQAGGTMVIPGHGSVSQEADVVDYRDMVTIIRDRVLAWKAQGMTLDQVQKADPTKGYRRRYGSDSGPWTTTRFVAAIYNTLDDK